MEVEKGEKVALALAGMPWTMARLSLPVWKEETLNALRSVIRGGADQVTVDMVGEGGSTVGVVVTVRTSGRIVGTDRLGPRNWGDRGKDRRSGHPEGGGGYEVTGENELSRTHTGATP